MVRVVVRPRTLIAGVALMAFALSIPAPSLAASPRTVLRAPKPIAGLSARGGYLAYAVEVRPWTSANGFAGCAAVRRLTIATRYTLKITSCPPDRAPADDQYGARVASIGATVGYAALTEDESGNGLQVSFGWSVGVYPFTPAPIDHGGHVRSCGGTDLADLAAGGGFVAYSLLEWQYTGGGLPGECPINAQGERAVSGSVQIVSQPPARTVSAPAGARISAGGGRIAVQPYELPGPANGDPPAVSPTIELWDVVGDSQLATVMPSGRLLSFALGSSVLAVAIQSPSGTDHIVRYDAATGAKIGSSPLATPLTSRLAVRGNSIVYALGRRVMWENASTGGVHHVFTASAPPAHLTTSGSQAFWCEHGRIVRSIAL